MACSVILNSWSLSSLIGSFLDLGMAYLLLCCSALAYFTSKFLSLFNLSLPCPCNGLFGRNPDSLKCLQRFLADAPSRKISSVRYSIFTRFPFDRIWPLDRHPRIDLRSLCDIDADDSCSSQGLPSGRPPVEFAASPISAPDDKGKAVSCVKPPSGRLRRRRNSCTVDRGKAATPTGSAASSSSRLLLIGGSKKREFDDEGSVNVVGCELDQERLSRNGSLEGTPPGNESEGQHFEDNIKEDDAVSIEELVRNAQSAGCNGNEADTIRILEQALKKERAAYNALYLELEKERNAAATAADEAMAMILRLQEEKALIEMEARQYQRMIEEKSSYDEEEMNILKEILVRRETEKHYLEKEVEAYRQMLFPSDGNPERGDDIRYMVDEDGEIPYPYIVSADDPVLMLQKINESIGKEANTYCSRFSEGRPSAEKEFLSHNSTNGADCLKRGVSQSVKNVDIYSLGLPNYLDASDVEFQEKGMVYMDECQSTAREKGMQFERKSSFNKLYDSQAHGFHGKVLHFGEEAHEKEDNNEIFHETVRGSHENQSENKMKLLKCGCDQYNCNENAGKRCSDHQICHSETESSVYDVHVVDDKSKMCGEGSRKESAVQAMSNASKSSDKSVCSLESSNVGKDDAYRGITHLDRSREAEKNIDRSNSDMSLALPTRDSSQSKVSPDLRRHSIPLVDNELVKLETEVGWLTERLKVVQEGREKLSFNMDYRGRKKSELQLLEEISHQLHEIRLRTQPRKTTRQASLPPSSSKVNSKKRRCRSVSCGTQDSS